jgi:prophage regulatory protein
LIREKHHECVHRSNFSDESTFKISQVCEITGLSRPTIYLMMNSKSPRYDETFPKPVKLSVNRVAWSAREINQWIETKLASRK